MILKTIHIQVSNHQFRLVGQANTSVKCFATRSIYRAIPSQRNCTQDRKTRLDRKSGQAVDVKDENITMLPACAGTCQAKIKTEHQLDTTHVGVRCEASPESSTPRPVFSPWHDRLVQTLENTPRISVQKRGAQITKIRMGVTSGNCTPCFKKDEDATEKV